MSIGIKSVNKKFGAFTALNDVSLEVKSGELLALLGPSGSGKTTLLRIIAGLETPDSGAIFFHGDDATNRNARNRQVGFVFQHYALFRHMTIFENIAFGLRVRPYKLRPSRDVIRDKVMNLLTMVQLEGLAGRHPSELSGGQRQRVALARALAVEPKVLLLDEPFGALDAKVRLELRQWLRQLHDELHITSVFVTHDQEEALEVSDRVVVMNQGRIEQIGTPQDVYDHPANPFVYNFLGNVNLFHGRSHDGHVHLSTPEMDASGHVGDNHVPVIGYVRPHDLDIARQPSGVTSISAVIQHIHTVGPVVRLELRRCDNDEPIAATLAHERYRDMALRRGETVHVTPKNVQFFTPDEDYSI